MSKTNIQSGVVQDQIIESNSGISKIAKSTTETNLSKDGPSESNPLILGNGFLKTKLYVKNGKLYSFMINDEEKEVSEWSDDFQIIDKSGYFTMLGKLYFISNSYTGSIGSINNNSKIIPYSCINGLDLDGTFFVTGTKQEIKFSGEKQCFNSDYINALYDNSGIYILEISSSAKLKYFPGIDGKSLKSISENEIGDDRGNIIKSECGPGGCEYSKK